MKGQRQVRFGWFMIISLVLLVIITALSLLYGSIDISWQSVLEALSGDVSTQQHIAIAELRLPRTLADVLCGAAFACAGAMMQGITRNPLADSSLLGINAGASFALALCLAFAPGMAFGWMVGAAFAGAAGASAILFLLLKAARGSLDPVRLVLAGSAVSIFLTSVTTGLALFTNIGQDLTFWTAGGTAGVRMNQIAWAAPVIVTGLVLAWLGAGKVGVLSLGDQSAQSLGVNVEKTTLECLFVVLLLAGTAVALAGPIAFAGLLVPYVVRFFVGSDYRQVIPGSMIAGAVILTAFDLLSRRINPPAETPVGLLFGVIGVPLFIWLVRKGGAGID